MMKDHIKKDEVKTSSFALLIYYLHPQILEIFMAMVNVVI